MLDGVEGIRSAPALARQSGEDDSIDTGRELNWKLGERLDAAHRHCAQIVNRTSDSDYCRYGEGFDWGGFSSQAKAKREYRLTSRPCKTFPIVPALVSRV